MNWSASGEWGLDSWEGDLGSDIFRFRADESELIRLTFNKAWDLFPAWSPPISLAWRGWINAFVGFALLLVWIAPAVRR
jgi:hypothetical protein